MPRVSVVIPNWNRSALLKKLLEDLAAQDLRPDEVIVVDNGSTDDSVSMARAAGATVIELSANKGFSKAVNRGIERCQGDWIAILNNDIELEHDWLSKLLDRAIRSNSWFASGKILNAANRRYLDGTDDALCRGACAWRCGHGRVDGPVWNQSRTIQFASFTAAIFRSDLFRKLGPLDEEFESYMEDVEFGIRCSIQHLDGVYVSEAVAYHHGSATLGRWHAVTVRNIARNQLLLVAKHYPANWIWRAGWAVLVAQSLWGLVALRHGAGLAFLAGKLDGLRRFRHARKPGSPALWNVLEQSEQQIRELQNRTGFDFYWRTYFALTRWRRHPICADLSTPA